MHGLRTIASIVHRWAPNSDANDEATYAGVVASLTRFGVDDVLDLHDGATMRTLTWAMAIMEGGRAIQWPPEEQISGLRLAGLTV